MRQTLFRRLLEKIEIPRCSFQEYNHPDHPAMSSRFPARCSSMSAPNMSTPKKRQKKIPYSHYPRHAQDPRIKSRLWAL